MKNLPLRPFVRSPLREMNWTCVTGRHWLKTKILFALSKPADYASKSGYFCGGGQREFLT
jgi:hypothetical protein